MNSGGTFSLPGGGLDAFGGTGSDFTGREFDNFTGLYYYRARMYDPELGRFTAEDPIGFGGGDVNLYGYVWNNPTNLVDPLGLDGWGNDLADWLDDNIDRAHGFYRSRDVQNWQWNGGVDTVRDLASGASDAFRVGSGLGDALYTPDENGWGRAAFVAMDVARAAGIASLLGGGTARLSTYPRPRLCQPKARGNPAESWLGVDSKVITNPAGDKVVLSQDGSRRIRFDFNRPHPHRNPHMHVEQKINGRWKKSGPIYPRGVTPE